MGILKRLAQMGAVTATSVIVVAANTEVSYDHTYACCFATLCSFEKVTECRCFPDTTRQHCTRIAPIHNVHIPTNAAADGEGASWLWEQFRSLRRRRVHVPSYREWQGRRHADGGTPAAGVYLLRLLRSASDSVWLLGAALRQDCFSAATTPSRSVCVLPGVTAELTFCCSLLCCSLLRQKWWHGEIVPGAELWETVRQAWPQR